MTDWGEVLVSGLDYYGELPWQGNNYNYLSKPVKGDGLVHRASGYHTIQIHTINFSGTITIEATLSRDPAQGPWLPIPLTNTATGEVFTSLPFQFVYPVPGVPYSGKTLETNQFFSAVGQYAWLRANITNISAGKCELIKIAY